MKVRDLESFLVAARINTYASNEGKVKPALDSSTQLEYREGDWLYRDVYYTGHHTFYGIETIFYKDKPVYGMSYYGNWGEMTEIEIDQILRGALVANPRTRLYENIEWEKDGFIYKCVPESNESIEEIGGSETITKEGMDMYLFYYAGGLLVEG